MIRTFTPRNRVRADDQLFGTVQYAQVPTGLLVQRSAATPYTTNTSVSATIPWDDTPPQSGEGTQILTVTHAMLTSTNRIVARFRGGFAVDSANNHVCYSLISSTATLAIHADATNCPNADRSYTGALEYEYGPGATTGITYSVRVGPDDPTVKIRMNGTTATRKFGGVAQCTLIIEEVKA